VLDTLQVCATKDTSTLISVRRRLHRLCRMRVVTVRRLMRTSLCLLDRSFASRPQMYNVTLKVLKDAGNERMWFNTALKLAKLHVQTRSYKDASTLVQQLRRYDGDPPHGCCIQ
jgi:hypothetical protein